MYDNSVKKRREGVPPHKMSLLIDVEMGRPFEVEVSHLYSLHFGSEWIVDWAGVG